MCMACEEAELYYRWQLLERIAKGEMPDGLHRGRSARHATANAGRNRSLRRAGRHDFIPQGAKGGASQAVRVRLRQPGRMTELIELTIAQARDLLRSRKISAAELAEAHIAAVERARALNAFVEETPRERARHGESRGRAACGPEPRVRSKAFRSGSRICSAPGMSARRRRRASSTNFVPTYESTVTANLWRDGAVMLGKLNNDEFAMGSSNETSFFGPVVSPWRRRNSNREHRAGRFVRAARRQRSPRGSASARPAPTPAVRSGSLPPTRGSSASSRPTAAARAWGIVAFASSLDQAGPFARTVADAAILLRSMAGHDPKDTTSVDRAVPDYEAAVGALDQRHEDRDSEGISCRRHGGGRSRHSGSVAPSG